jgi:hypothetical protein
MNAQPSPRGRIPRPGPGWSRLGHAPVWEHSQTCVRIHLFGTVRFGDGTHEEADRWPVSKSLWHHIRMAGGNRKRGLMTWALGRIAEKEACRG